MELMDRSLRPSIVRLEKWWVELKRPCRMFTDCNKWATVRLDWDGIIVPSSIYDLWAAISSSLTEIEVSVNCYDELISPWPNVCIILNQTAIKKMKKKFYTWEECMQLREVKVCVVIHFIIWVTFLGIPNVGILRILMHIFLGIFCNCSACFCR